MNFKDPNLKILNFTHVDFDGMVSAIVMKNYYSNIEVYQINYGKERESLDIALSKRDSIDAIVFTDFTPNNLGMFQKIGKPVLVLDHHESVLAMNDPQNDVFISTKYCGALMVYKYFNVENKLSHLEELVKIANDFDMWILKDVRSMFFNAMAFEMGFNWFVNRFINGNIDLYPEEKLFLKNYQKDYKKFYDELPLSELSNNGAFVEVNKYLAEVSRDLRKDGYEWLIMKHGKGLSLRSNRDDLDLTQVAKILGKGGGHKKAIGMSITKNMRDEIIDIEKAVETSISASFIE